MHTTKTQASAALRRQAAWVRKLDWDAGQRESTQHRATDVVIGCYRVLRGCGTDVAAWIERQPRRKALRKPMIAVRSESGRKAIAELLALSAVALDARNWDTDAVEVGPLPVAPPKHISPQQRDAMIGAAKARRDARKQADDELRQKRADFVSRLREDGPDIDPSTNDAKTVEKPREIDGVFECPLAPAPEPNQAT